MNRAELFVGEFLEHRSAYDPIKAREYYLRTRKLKGRDKAATKPTPSKSKVLNEDEIPSKSPNGAKLVDFDGKNGGTATYSDGSVLSTKGWSKTNSAGVAKARQTNADVRKESLSRSRRIGAQEQKLIRAKTKADKIKDPAEKKRTLDFLNKLEGRLKQLKLNTRDQRQLK